MDSLKLEAPGKLFLAGEFAVLEEGRSALVAAVDRTLQLSLRGDAQPIVELWHKPSFVALIGELTGEPSRPVAWVGGIPDELRFAARATDLALRLCAEEKLAPRGYHATFENDFTADDFTQYSPSPSPSHSPSTSPSASTSRTPPKPGLGGSAAATVLAIRAACRAQLRQTAPQDLLALASAAHWVEQSGRGSGADIAASSLGGVLEVRIRRPLPSPEALWSGTAHSILTDPLIEATSVSLPADLTLVAVWSGNSADTRVLMREVRAFAAGRPDLFRARIDRISASAAALKSALAAAATDRSDSALEPIFSALREGAAAMAALGEEAGCAIVTPGLAEICAIASSAGCAGKPSGAGGGDCAIVFAFSDQAVARVRAALGSRGYVSRVMSIAPTS